MFCLNCFPRNNSDDSTETPNKKIHIKHCHTKHYTLIPDANTQHLTQFNFNRPSIFRIFDIMDFFCRRKYL